MKAKDTNAFYIDDYNSFNRFLEIG